MNPLRLCGACDELLLTQVLELIMRMMSNTFHVSMQRAIMIVALQATCILTAAGSIAEESTAALCSAKLRKFVTAIDLIFAENPGSVLDYYGPIRDYLSGTHGCNVNEVIS